MPKYHKCYFGCKTYDILHRFPNPLYNEEKFNLWKRVLDPEMHESDPKYVYNNLRLCGKHFESQYHTPSRKLTRNAFPTLNIGLHDMAQPLLQNEMLMSEMNNAVPNVLQDKTILNIPDIETSFTSIDMEPAAKDVKLNNIEEMPQSNICRCCLKGGCFKDISLEYYHFGRKEIYEEMLKTTFDIQMSNQEPIRPVNMICEDCITRLRDASTFKQMVLENEDSYHQIIEALKLDNGRGTKMIDDDVKLEAIKYESAQVMDFGDDSFDDDEILANVKQELTETSVLLESNKYIHDRRRNSKLKKCKIKTNGGGNIQKDWSKIAERRGNGPILRENSLKLLANSTIFVFQWNKSRYRCFCCKEPFSDVNLLRDHTNTKHSLKAVEKKIIEQQNRLVKVEVSVLNCKICGQNLDNLSILRDHLSDTHKLKFESTEDLLVPFKIGELCCQICNEKFTVFRLLNIHMNKHFQKQVCHICGAGFSNLVFLNLHKSRSHKPLKCRHCAIVFSNKIDKKNHDTSVHGVKFERKLRFPCPYCNDRFFQENFRVQHLVEKHGLVKPEFKCDICSKVFITKSLCNNHLKNVHLKEKCHECDVCHNFFYTKSDVARHKVTHSGEKNFSCTLCNNFFASKDSLRRHMKRTHGVH